jgi:uncharacterized protein YidB (DUF937 family)
MILKEADSKNAQITELESLLAHSGVPDDKKTRIARELKFLRAGIKGENESAYDVDFFSGAHENRIVIHDLRVEHDGRVAQIDHLIMNRLLEVYVLETKHFSEGVSINEQGEFSIWFGGKPQGIASPLEQNDRHVAVLRDVFKSLKMPTRLGIRLQPTFESLVLVSKNARIGRPKQFDTSRVLKSDQLQSWISKNLDSISPLMITKIVGMETLTDIARQLVALHRPLVPDFHAKFGVTEAMLQQADLTASAPTESSTAVRNGPEATRASDSGKLTTSKLAQKQGLKTADLTARLIEVGLLELRDGKSYITPKGKVAGGEFRMSPKTGPYFLWPVDLTI